MLFNVPEKKLPVQKEGTKNTEAEGAVSSSTSIWPNYVLFLMNLNNNAHYATSRGVPGSIPSGVAGDFFRSYRRNHVPWGRLSL
jgi:hypothetical protein